jgi:SAM-dependent methyltransferase
MTSELVLWHDIECGSYAEDLTAWRELAAAAGGPILDVGAGTGRVAIDLARAGHDVVALDVEPELLAALRERAGDLAIETVAADARAFDLGRRFALIIAPMQTVQLLAGRHEDFVACAARHLRPGGALAVALANPPAYDGDVKPLPDMREDAGWLWASHPVSVRSRPEGMAIQRVRETVAPDGTRTVADDEIVLTRLAPEDLEAAGERHGLSPLPRLEVPETADYVGSEVVVLGA